MKLLASSALGLALLAIPILVLYMLKLRRREVQVSSTLLWQMLLRDRQANAPWQRLKRNLLLFLQLLILAALVLALARPALAVPGPAAGSVVVLLDASASMNAQDGGVNSLTRFEAARNLAAGLIEGLPSRGRMTLILVGRSPQALVSAEDDKAELRKALAAARPTQQVADWEAAFALAAGAASAGATSRESQDSTVVVISDGGLPQEGLPPLPVPVRYLPVGQEGENLAVSALAARPSADHAELFASVANYGDQPRSAILSFYADGQLFDARQVSLPAGGSQDLVVKDLPNRPARLAVRLSSPDTDGRPLDPLPLDDAAYTVYQPQLSGRTLLVSSGNVFLERLLSSLPGIEPFRVLPGPAGAIQLPAEKFDLYVLDGVLPQNLPSSNLLLVNPPPNDLFEVSGTFTDTAGTLVPGSPLLEYVDWSNIHIRQARKITPPAWANVLVRAPSGPLVFAGETGGRRIAVLAFDLHDSDLPLQVAFPILFSNLIHYLVQSQPVQVSGQSGELQPGESVVIRPGEDLGEVQVTSPSGVVHALKPAEDGSFFTQADEAGIYRLDFPGTPSRQSAYFAVNLFSPLESDIQPAQAIQVGNSVVPVSTGEKAGQRELWPWLAALGLLFLAIEWWMYHRSQGLPARWRDRLRPRRI